MFKTAWKGHPGISRIDKKPKAHRIIIFRGSSSWSVIIRQLFRGVCLLSLLLSKLYNDFPVEERTHRETYFNTNAHWNSIRRNQCYSKHVMETHQMSTLLIYIILYDLASTILSYMTLLHKGRLPQGSYIAICNHMIQDGTPLQYVSKRL